MTEKRGGSDVGAATDTHAINENGEFKVLRNISSMDILNSSIPSIHYYCVRSISINGRPFITFFRCSVNRAYKTIS